MSEGNKTPLAHISSPPSTFTHTFFSEVIPLFFTSDSVVSIIWIPLTWASTGNSVLLVQRHQAACVDGGLRWLLLLNSFWVGLLDPSSAVKR